MYCFLRFSYCKDTLIKPDSIFDTTLQVAYYKQAESNEKNKIAENENQSGIPIPIIASLILVIGSWITIILKYLLVDRKNLANDKQRLIIEEKSFELEKEKFKDWVKRKKYNSAIKEEP